MNDPLPVEHMDKADDLYVLTEFFRERVKSVVLYAKQNGLREETMKLHQNGFYKLTILWRPADVRVASSTKCVNEGLQSFVWR